MLGMLTQTGHLAGVGSLESKHRGLQMARRDAASVEAVFLEGSKHFFKTGSEPSELLKSYSRILDL